MDSLISDQLPHHLDGTAQFELSKLSFRRGRVEEIKGTLSAGPGVISYTLLDGDKALSTSALEINLRARAAVFAPVSYTHLTLPTIYSV